MYHSAAIVLVVVRWKQTNQNEIENTFLCAINFSSTSLFFPSLTLIDHRLIKAISTCFIHNTSSHIRQIPIDFFSSWFVFFFFTQHKFFRKLFYFFFLYFNRYWHPYRALTHLHNQKTYIFYHHIIFLFTCRFFFFGVSLQSFGKFVVFSMVRAISGIAHETRFIKWWHKYM